MKAPIGAVWNPLTSLLQKKTEAISVIFSSSKTLKGEALPHHRGKKLKSLSISSSIMATEPLLFFDSGAAGLPNLETAKRKLAAGW